MGANITTSITPLTILSITPKSESIDSEGVGAHQIPQTFISSSPKTDETVSIGSMPTFGLPPPIPTIPPIPVIPSVPPSIGVSSSLPQPASGRMSTSSFSPDQKHNEPLIPESNETDPWKKYVTTQYKFMSTLISQESYGGKLPGISDDDLFGFSTSDDDELY